MATHRFRWLVWLAGLVLILNFAVLMIYGMAIRSTYAFVASGTVFYPLADLNLILGVVSILLLVRDIFVSK